MKLAVIVPTYYRGGNTTLVTLHAMFKMLYAQTYSDFKLFLVGDCYTEHTELEQIASTYKKDIHCADMENHYRWLSDTYSRWCVGGVRAIHYGVKQAICEGFDYYLHLDDDDYWEPNHIEDVVNVIKLYPDTDIIISKSQYLNVYLPKNAPTALGYNNYIPKGCDSVHSSSTLKLHTVGSHICNLCKEISTNVVPYDEQGIKFIPFDMQLLDIFNQEVVNGNLRCVCSSTCTVSKRTDGNYPQKELLEQSLE